MTSSSAASRPRGRVPAIGRTVTRKPEDGDDADCADLAPETGSSRPSRSRRTSSSGEAPISVADGSSNRYMYGAGLVTRSMR